MCIGTYTIKQNNDKNAEALQKAPQSDTAPKKEGRQA